MDFKLQDWAAVATIMSMVIGGLVALRLSVGFEGLQRPRVGTRPFAFAGHWS